ncbi:MAG: aerobic carbon-monoxide dehydrogenase large subunit [Thermoleophilaceae bacterium]|jgi:carbon-monoxide dehydrogenase large subunit|nr:aerobic carbon-monoxide dehydrogenase large subunit [Thermoleophilaceae bacterium]
MADGNGTTKVGAFGTRVKRVEDPRLLRGDGRYIADLKLHGMVHAAVIRSPHAHARIVSIDKSEALADPRTIAVFTAADLPEMPPLTCIDAEETTLPFNQQVMASDKVRFVGEPVAVIVAEDRYVAEDIMGLVDVEYEPLPAVVDPEEAMKDGAPLVHHDTNVVDTLEYELGDPKDAMANAPHTLSERLVTQRYAAMPMETRGCIADWDERWETLTLHSSTQVPNGVKANLQTFLGLGENSVRVIVPDIGGAFGVKIQIYPEEVFISFLARELRRPVKWIEDRWEHFVGSCHGREQIHDVTVGFDDDGRILSLRDDCITNTGAYLQSLTLVEPFIGVAMLAGMYQIENFEATSTVVVTNKTPMNPFRGVGHVQAAFTMERIIDLIAQERGLDPAEVRMVNLIQPDQFPLAKGIGNVLAGEIIYDTGDYPRVLKRALELAGYDEFRAKQEGLRAEGRHVGIGIGAFVEETGLGPYESATVRVEPSGGIAVYTGSCPSGQGHHTVFAQIAADELGVDISDVKVIHGDTDLVRSGVGTYASRSAAVGGGAVRNAAGGVRKKILAVTERLVEAAASRHELADGRVQVKGSPSRSVALGDVALAVSPGRALPDGIEAYGLEHTDIFHPESNTFSSGVHIATVEVDVETGLVNILQYVACDDSGRIINPLLFEGQTHGGVTLGIGGALLEEVVYDDEGQPRNPNFMDYLIPGIGNMPEKFITDHVQSPTYLNKDGIKGGGEGGAVGAPAAIANAVADALRPARVTATPLTPERVFRLAQAAGLVGDQTP